MEARGLIKRLPADKRKVEDALKLAQRDIKAARKMLADNHDWAFSIAYNSMLQAARALMFSMSFRPSGEAQHVAVVMFAEAVFGKDNDAVLLFDRMRRKRHTTIYDTAGTISEDEAKNAVRHASEFLDMIKEKIK